MAQHLELHVDQTVMLGPTSLTPLIQMYSLLLEVQDFEKRFVQTPEEDREALLEQHKANTVQLCNSLREKEWEDRCVTNVLDKNAETYLSQC